MRAVIQRVRQSSVTVHDEVVGQIELGLLVLLGVGKGDGPAEARYLADRIAGLRIFADEAGKMNLSIKQVGGSALVVSQFTLYADVDRGRRPSFTGAADPKTANELYQLFCEELKKLDVHVQTGIFQADMQVKLINDGPVTIIIDSAKS
jgi:D-aminoacyl-tRNA deacylase